MKRETEPFRRAGINISPSGIIISQGLLLNPAPILNKPSYFYTSYGDNIVRHKSYIAAAKRLITILEEEYEVEEWVDGLAEEDVARVGFGGYSSKYRYYYSISIYHDLLTYTYEVSPAEYDGRHADGLPDKYSTTIPDTATAEELAIALKATYDILETICPIPDKYRTLPKNTNKLIAKWRKDHPDDPRTLWDVENDRREGIDTV